MHLSSEHRGNGERVYQWIIEIVKENIIIIVFISSKLLVNQATIWSKVLHHLMANSNGDLISDIFSKKDRHLHLFQCKKPFDNIYQKKEKEISDKRYICISVFIGKTDIQI